MKTADNRPTTEFVRPDEGSLLLFGIGFAKEDKFSADCQGKLLDCFYIRDYGVD